MALDPRLSLAVDAPFDVGASIRGAQDRNRQISMDQQSMDVNALKMRMAKLDEATKKMELTNQALGRAVDQPSYDRERAWLQQQGLDVSSAPPIFDPNFVRQQQMASMDVADKLKLARDEAMGALQQDLVRARIGTENAQAGSFDALARRRDREDVEPAAGSSSFMPEPAGGLQPPPVVPGSNPTPLLPAPNAPITKFGKAPSGYRFKADGTLEPIPGGPGEAISGELAARLGLADDALLQLPGFIEKAKKGQLAGPIDYAMGKLGRGEQGKQYREIDAASEALTRMLTGAGMNIEEARREANLYKPTIKDDDAAVASKAEQLQRRLKSVSEVARKGRGGNATQSASSTEQDFTNMSDDEIKKALGL